MSALFLSHCRLCSHLLSAGLADPDPVFLTWLPASLTDLCDILFVQPYLYADDKGRGPMQLTEPGRIK